MNTELQNFVSKARERQMGDEEIRQKLVTSGWPEADVTTALNGTDDLLVPVPPSGSSEALKSAGHPISVVENLTPRGFEYKIFSVSLILALLAIVIIANLMFSGGDKWASAAFPLTMLIVTGPIATFLFLRLHRAEQTIPALKHDASRRKVLQAIQLITFLALIGHTIVLLYLIISGQYSNSMSLNYSGSTASKPNLIGDIIRWLVTVVVAGGTFLYYWRDEHKNG